MWSFDLLRATRSVEKTMPFVLYRWLIFLAVAAGLLLSTLAGAGTAIGLSSLSSNPTLFANFGAIAGFCGFLWLLFKVRKTLFYHVGAPHLMLLARIAEGEILPQGKAQYDDAKQRFRAIFPSSSDLWQLKQSIGETLAALPPHSAPSLVRHAQPQIARCLSAGFERISRLNADGIMAKLSMQPSAHWRIAASELVHAAENLPSLLKNRLSLTVFEIVGWILAYAVLLVPAKSIAASLPVETGIWPYVFALVFSWNIKASFLEPISQAAMLQVFRQLPSATAGDETEKTLATQSDAFRRIIARSGPGAVAG